MLPITTAFNTARFQKDITTYGRQAVFAAAVAINRTLEQKQGQLRGHVKSRLTIRNAKARQFFADAIQFGRNDRADLRRQPLAGRIIIVGGNQQARTSLFRRFGQMLIRQEEGGTSTSNAMYRTQGNQLTVGGFALPAPGLRGANKAVPRKIYPTAIGLTTRRAIAGGNEFATQYKGGKKKRGGFRKNTRYFFVKENVGIFVREQLGKESEYDAVWFFRRRVQIPKRLRLEETFTGGLEERFRVNYEKALDEALRTAR